MLPEDPDEMIPIQDRQEYERLCLENGVEPEDDASIRELGKRGLLDAERRDPAPWFGCSRGGKVGKRMRASWVLDRSWYFAGLTEARDRSATRAGGG